MFEKIKNYLLNYPDAAINRRLNLGLFVFAVFVALHAWLHFNTLTVIIVVPLIAWIGIGFITIVGFVKALYDTTMSRTRRSFNLIAAVLAMLMIFVGPVLVLLMYYRIIPFPPE